MANIDKLYIMRGIKEVAVNNSYTDEFMRAVEKTGYDDTRLILCNGNFYCVYGDSRPYLWKKPTAQKVILQKKLKPEVIDVSK